MTGIPYPGQAWIPAPPPPKRSRGKIAGITIGIVAGVCVICVVLGALAWPSFKKGFDEGLKRAANPTTPAASPSPTRDITAVPAVGLCYTASGSFFYSDRDLYTGAESDTVVPCSQPHNLETVDVGALPDSVTAVGGIVTASMLIDEYDRCSAAVDAFVGRPWAGTYSWAIISVPSTTGWSAGAHWYRCDVMGSTGVGNAKATTTTGSMKGAAKPITCVSWIVNSDGSLSNTTGSDCGVSHNGEVIGAGPMPAGVDLTNRDAVETAVGKLCDPFITSYMGEVNGQLPDGLWMSYFRPSKTQADGLLDQNIICIIAPQDKSRMLTGTLKNLGGSPIPYAS